ncbi:hypothetical protein ACFPJ2_13520 [Microbacterium suwonense]
MPAGVTHGNLTPGALMVWAERVAESAPPLTRDQAKVILSVFRESFEAIAKENAESRTRLDGAA